MTSNRFSKNKSGDKVLTVQVHHQNLDPRTFKVPVKWIYRSSILAWLLIAISLTATFYAVKTYRMKGGNQFGLIAELEREIRELKAAGAGSGSNSTGTPTTTTSEDPNARDTIPEDEAGQPLASQEGIWTGLAPQITLPPRGTLPSVELNNVKISWQGKYAVITGVVAYREQGKGSQQGHLVVLARGRDRIIGHPENILNVPSSSYLFNPENGEYFSVARFRILKTKLGPFESATQLEQIQVYLFDTENKLILTQSYPYGKK